MEINYKMDCVIEEIVTCLTNIDYLMDDIKEQVLTNTTINKHDVDITYVDIDFIKINRLKSELCNGLVTPNNYRKNILRTKLFFYEIIGIIYELEDTIDTISYFLTLSDTVSEIDSVSENSCILDDDKTINSCLKDINTNYVTILENLRILGASYD